MIDAWMNQALIGVERAEAPPVAGDIGALLAQIGESGDDPALLFSRYIGVLGACRLAAVTFDASNDRPPAPAPDDSCAIAAEHPWNAVLASVFADGPVRLQHEACMRVADMRASLPFQLLPQALEAGRRNAILRPVLQSVLGSRGRWLAQFNADWRYAADGVTDVAAGEDPKLWSEGNLAQRTRYLRGLRARDPKAAGDLLLAQMGELAAKERLELVAELAQGLGPRDEALLESLLKDRSRDVRDLAARLLAKLPQSAHARRLIEWLTPLVTQKRSFLVRSWGCDAPERADPAWQAAAIDSNRPQHDALGDRAWWLCQIVRQVPLSWWVSHLRMDARDVIAWAAKTDWNAALQRGWLERVDAADRDWIDAMLVSSEETFRRHTRDLLALLPVVEREKHWLRTLDNLTRDGALGEIVGACAFGETLSAAFSRALLGEVRVCMESDRLRNDYALRAQALELATIVHPASLLDWRPAARRDDETPALVECIHEFERIVGARRALHSPVPRSIPPEPQ